MSGRTARAARKGSSGSKKPPPVQAPKARAGQRSRGRLAIWALFVGVAAVLGLYGLTRVGSPDGSPDGSQGAQGSSEYPYEIGKPGPGDAVLPLTLPSTAGGEFDLADYRGKDQVLLFFHEGLTCQPCWDQMKAIQQRLDEFRALGVGPIVGVTTDSLPLIDRKVADEGITLPVLADVGGQFSAAWEMNRYQMMGMGERPGHSFVLVGTDGEVLWRADYGGAPKYTMFLPVDALLRDLKTGMQNAA